MLKQTGSRPQTLTTEMTRTLQRNLPLPEPLSAVSRMVAPICHDLRLPMTAILANAEFLAHCELNLTEKADLYQEIRSSIDRMSELISSLVEYSRDRDT